MSRVGYLAIVVVVLAGASALVVRRGAERAPASLPEGRPSRSVHGTAGLVRDLFVSRSERDAKVSRETATALLESRRSGAAFSIFASLLQEHTSGSDLVRSIHASDDAALLTDLSAAALDVSGDRNLLLAYEAADRAWHLSPTVEAGWNRARAAQRIGMYAFAERTWREVRSRESDEQWAAAAEKHRADARRSAGAQPPPSLELFFYRQMFVGARAGEALRDPIAGDRMASDTSVAIASLRGAARNGFEAALTAHLQAQDLVDRSEVAAARDAYLAAEKELESLRVPLAWVTRDQRIRCDCVLEIPGCLEAMRNLQRELRATNRYPWLVARTIYGEGQILYRQGHVYEAEQHLSRALHEFEKLGDATSAAQMHVLLTNVYAAGGESDLALRHFLLGVAVRTPNIVDRRRRILEDGIAFMLRHGYLATAELLLDEMTTVSTTLAADISEAMLQGVVAFRRRNRHRAAERFAVARRLLSGVQDEATRSDLQFRLAIAEAGCRLQAATPLRAELDAAIAVHSGSEHSIWLPQLLTERGAALERARDVAGAEADYRRAIAILEAREPRIDETVLALGIAAPNESPFDRMVRLLIEQRRIAGALSVAQRASALRISSLHARGARVRDVFRQMRRHDDGIAATQQAVREGEVAIVQYLLHDELITWLITKDGIRATRSAAQREKLLREAESPGPALSRTLLQPWIERVPRGATLLLQPAPEMESIPYAMLETHGERLLQRNPMATVPSLGALANAVRHDFARAGDVDAFFAAAPKPGNGLGPLPRTIPEIRRAARRYAHATVEPRATRAQFLAQSPRFPIVHIAGHIVVDPARPLFSALAFEDGRLLYVHELDESSFAKTRLIVLSGCDSGHAPRPTMSVANALLSQNVPSVVYTLRAVDDSVAEEFAIAFHGALAAGRSRAAALRHAQLTLMRSHPGTPAIWSAFGLAGAAGPLTETQTKEES